MSTVKRDRARLAGDLAGRGNGARRLADVECRVDRAPHSSRHPSRHQSSRHIEASPEARAPWATMLAALLLITSASCTDGPPCITNRDCPSTQQCVANLCVPTSTIAMCVTPDDCSLSETCKDGRCVAVEAACDACGPGTTCDLSTGECHPFSPRCADDKACDPPRSICVDEQCVAGCGVDGGLTCRSPASCNRDVGRCEAPPGCEDDDACHPPESICVERACQPGCAASRETCPEGSRCSEETGRCEAEARPCDEDTDCEIPGEICEGTTCVPSCVSRSSTCKSEERCNQVTGRCEAIPCLRDGDCAPSGGVCDVGASRCVPPCTPDGCATPTVCLPNGHCGPKPCELDVLEPNDAIATASTRIPGQFSQLTACPGDQDFFTLRLEPYQAIVVKASNDENEGNVDLELLNATAHVVAAATSTSGLESIRYASDVGGRFVLRAFLAEDRGARPGTAYDLDVATECDADRFEDNDTAETATSIEAGRLTGLRSCAGDDDYYAMNLGANTDVSLTVSFRRAEGDINVSVVGPEGAPVATGVSSGDNEALVFRTSTAGRHIARVFMAVPGESTYGASYDLEVSSVVTTNVTFEITGVDFTTVGQDVYVVGSASELGSWQPTSGLRLNGSAFPTWRGSVNLPRGAQVRFKSIIIDRNQSNRVTWEAGGNHEFTVPETPTTVSRAWRRS